MFNKLKQVNDIRKQAKEMQKQLATMIVVGKSKGGKVMITMDGNQQIQGVQIEDNQSTSDIEKGVKSAFEDALKQLQRQMMSQMKDMGGLDGLKDLLGGE